jgi:hypothetical protein
MKFGNFIPRFLGGPSLGQVPDINKPENVNKKTGFANAVGGMVSSIKDILPVFEKFEGNKLTNPENKDPKKEKFGEPILKKITQKSLEKIKNIDWERAGISVSAGIGLKLCARTLFDVVGFWQKTGIAAVGGAGSAVVKEWIDQRKEADAILNKEYEKIFAKEYSSLGPNNPAARIIIDLERKKTSEGKLSVKDLKKFLKRNQENSEINLKDKDVSLKKEILDIVEKLEKKDWKRIATSAAKGAFWGAAGSMVFGDLLEYAVQHGFITVPNSVHDFIDWAKKGLVSNEIIGEVGADNSAIFVDMNVNPVKDYVKSISEHIYEFSSDKIQSLTEASRNVIHDYLSNEALVGGVLGKNNLSVEQLVYAEDYLRHALGGQDIKPGTHFSIKGGLVAEAVEKARNLTQSEIANIANNLKMPGQGLSNSVIDFMKSHSFSSHLNDVRKSFTPEINGKTVTNLLIVDIDQK